MKNFSCMTWLLQLIKIKPLQGLKNLKKPIRSYTLKLQFMFFDFAHISITAASRAASLKGVKLVQTKKHCSNLWGLPVLMTGFFLDAFPAPWNPKSADFSSFHLEFWVFSLSFEFFSWVLTDFFMFFS